MRVIQQFDQQWQKNGAKIYHVAHATELPEALTRISQRHAGNEGTHTVVAAGLSGAWEHLIRRVFPPEQLYVWKGGGNAEEFRQRCAQAGIGITGCAWAAADAGSVTLYGHGDQSLLPSLLPPVHVVILSTSQIFPTFAEGLAHLQSPGPHNALRPSLPPLIKMIAGPSMTGDIEGQLITGVHGPKDLYAIVMEEILV
ncbi:Uncharacterised ACR, YkgG family COG1556 [Sulfobacillus thermosulfidooxidans DSM 9293]|uniref:Uncharacterized ACR, YkgG family COG1556 n=1 Tax=Sulfobacillus thermosulfidooxidans (strain DSM 9293 / VKM B-1269 / AT-1) TaxID=929705 RepID=A0A1W1WEI8_SULTA|nr:lactate utilization protein [Sulfobacillus thermosulfidooxidans]SMC04687.1 Uncharacterised ACR, YkgG family COG1556 [Sulfobacillus thermosulfidooxidans DSM 9293]